MKRIFGKVFFAALIITSLSIDSIGLSKETTAGQAKTKSTEPSSTRAVMDQIFARIVTVLPMSLDSRKFADPKNRKLILQNLKELADSSKGLAGHVKSPDKSFEFIASSFARDARDIYRLYEKGSLSESRYLLHNLTENCVACHAKLPDTGHSPDAKAFFKDAKISELSSFNKVQLQVALREFDEAIATYEGILQNRSTRGSEIALSDAILEYLKLCIRVKGDLKRPVGVLEGISKRDDLPRFHREEIAHWKTSLERLAIEATKSGDELTRARSIIDAAQKDMDFPADRSGVVDYLVASSLLNKFVNTPRTDKTVLGEAYYLLGKTEDLIGRSYWLSQTEFYLETAIRMAPGAPFAAKAFNLLEQKIIFAYSGSAGLSIPEDDAQLLDELQALVTKHQR